MRRHRIIFLAAATMCTAGCPASKRDVATAKTSVYDAEFAVVYNAALTATRESYPELDDAPRRGLIRTRWHPVANNQDDLSNTRALAQSQGLPAASSTGAAGMPTRLAYKRFYIQFDVSILGGRPWRIKVVGRAQEWEPGAAQPNELHGVARPSWLEGRTDALIFSIYKRLKGYAVPAKEEAVDPVNEVKRADPTAFKDVPPEAAKRLAALKDALAARDYQAIRPQLADDVVWSLGGGTGADAAMATWQADPEALDAMGKALAAGCAGDARKVSCPPGTPAPGAYQLIVEPRGDAWRVTLFARAD